MLFEEITVIKRKKKHMPQVFKKYTRKIRFYHSLQRQHNHDLHFQDYYNSF